jgi:hypothetical protein
VFADHSALGIDWTKDVRNTRSGRASVYMDPLGPNGLIPTNDFPRSTGKECTLGCYCRLSLIFFLTLLRLRSALAAEPGMVFIPAGESLRGRSHALPDLKWFPTLLKDDRPVRKISSTRGTHLFGDPFRSANYVHTADRIKYKTLIKFLSWSECKDQKALFALP